MIYRYGYDIRSFIRRRRISSPKGISYAKHTSPVPAGTDIIANAPPSSFPGQRGRVAVPIRSDAGSLFQIFLSVFRDKSIYTFGLVRVAGKIVTGIRKNKKFMFYAVLSKQRVELL